ncbi:hypothetical protein TgHK011_005062 [Trichoderma gracile]|nr:hypothetical protein TgHK011_005062 [Trichoderma gracile]
MSGLDSVFIGKDDVEPGEIQLVEARTEQSRGGREMREEKHGYTQKRRCLASARVSGWCCVVVHKISRQGVAFGGIFSRTIS